MIESQITIYNFTLSKLTSNPPPVDRIVKSGLSWEDKVKRDLRKFFKEELFEKLVIDEPDLDLYKHFDSLQHVVSGSWTPLYSFADDDLTLDLNGTILNAAQYLLSVFPSLPIDGDMENISDTAYYNYLRKFEIVDDPARLVEFLGMGYLGRGDIIVASQLYPDLLQQIRVWAVELSIEYKKLSWKKRKQLSVLLGEQISTLSYADGAEESPQGKVSGRASSSKGWFQSEASEEQRRASR